MTCGSIPAASTLPQLHADVVAVAVAAEHRPVWALLDGGAAVDRDLARLHGSHGADDHDVAQAAAANFVVKSLISASSTVETMPSPIDAALPVICAAVCIEPPSPDNANVTSALA